MLLLNNLFCDFLVGVVIPWVLFVLGAKKLYSKGNLNRSLRFYIFILFFTSYNFKTELIYEHKLFSVSPLIWG